jgi:hypothetical protein
MPVLRMLMVLAVLPGLLMPGGIAVRLCFCSLLAGLRGTANACCSQPVNQCCCAVEATGDEARDRDDGATRVRRQKGACTCFVVVAPRDKSWSRPGPDEKQVHTQLPPERNVAKDVLSEIPAARYHVVLCDRPPPWSGRSMPLRI